MPCCGGQSLGDLVGEVADGKTNVNVKIKDARTAALGGTTRPRTTTPEWGYVPRSARDMTTGANRSREPTPVTYRSEYYLSVAVNACQASAVIDSVPPSRSVVSRMRTPSVAATSTHAPPLALL
jgi:hypothetical protein